MAKIDIRLKKGDSTIATISSDNTALDSLPAGEKINVWLQQAGFKDQYVGDMVNKGTVPIPPTTTCPQGQHWDAALGQCVPDVVTPPTGLIYSSNIQGEWNNGTVRFVLDKEGNTDANGFGFTVNASGGGGFRINGAGQGTLEPTSPGHRRIYICACNYNSKLKGKFAFLTGKERNASIKIRNRHQYRDMVNKDAPDSKCQGGLGFHYSIEDQKAGFQIEVVHGTNTGSFDVSLPKNLEVGKWYGFEVSVKDASSSTINVASKLDYNDGQGLRNIFSKTVSAPSVFFNKADFDTWSQFWLRLNDEGKLGWKDIEMTAI